MADQGDAQMEWYAVRVKQKAVGGMRSTLVGGAREAYRARNGQMRVRMVKGTQQRVFVPELILRRAGFEVFLPIRIEPRQINRFNRRKEFVTYPLLVGWLFVGWPIGEARWHDLMSLDVVMGVMGTGGRPVRIAERTVVRLMERWGGGHLSPECLRYMRTGGTVQAGDWAVVRDGSTAGLELLVTEISGQRVNGLASILGGAFDIPAEYDLAALDRHPTKNGPEAVDAACASSLAPCLRCGGSCSPDLHEGAHCVRCDDCGARGAVKQATEADAIALWNECLPDPDGSMASVNV